MVNITPEPTYFRNHGAANSSPHVLGRSDDSFPTILTHTVHPRVHGARMHQHLLQNHPGMAHPRVYGADPSSLTILSPSKGSSPCALGKYDHLIFVIFIGRFIPVCTGQILNPSGRFPCLVSHCFPSPWTFVTEPVCIILDSHIFADNTFWSILIRNDTF